MRPPIPFGQYVPGESILHTLEPRVKLALAAIYTIVLFSVDGFVGLFVVAILVGVVIAMSGVPLAIAFRGIRFVSLLLAFTLLAHAIRIEPATVAIVRAGPVAIDAHGLITGAFFGARILLLVVGTSLIALTTSPVRLVDALERLMSPLERVRFPAGEVAMMLTVALRFIPTTAEEAQKLVLAQTARGARFDRGGPLARARAYVPVLVPLFVALFRRADDLATAMDSRCYRGGVGRTRLLESRIGVSDALVLVAASGVMLAVGVTL